MRQFLKILLGMTVIGGVLWASLGAQESAIKSDWKIDARAIPDGDTNDRIDITLRRDVETVHITDSLLRIGSIQQAFVVQKRVVIFGSIENTQSVAIYDIDTKKRIDWFYCFSPQIIHGRYVAFVLYYPSHTSDDYDDVLCLYDLSKIGIGAKSTGERYPVRAGVPIYPSENASARSYENLAPLGTALEQIMSPPGIQELSDGSLVFVVTRGRYGSEYESVLVNLRSGSPGRPFGRVVEIPISIGSSSSVSSRKIYIDPTYIKQTGPHTVSIGVSPSSEISPSLAGGSISVNLPQ